MQLDALNPNLNSLQFHRIAFDRKRSIYRNLVEFRSVWVFIYTFLILSLFVSIGSSKSRIPNVQIFADHILLIGLDIRLNEIHVLKINIVWFLTNFRQIYCHWKWRVTNDHNQSIKSKSKRLNKLSNRMFRMIPLIPLSMILTYMTKRLFSISRATKVRCITTNTPTANMTIRSLKLCSFISTLKTV